MRSLRSVACSRFALALALFGSLAQQVGALAHGVMLARPGLPAGVLHEFCTSGGVVRAPQAPEPAKSPASAGGICDLCAAASMPPLPWAPEHALIVVPGIRDEPAFQPVAHLGSPPQRAYRSRAPPVPLPV